MFNNIENADKFKKEHSLKIQEWAEKNLNYSFKNIDFLWQAMIHSSFSYENNLYFPQSNERLEFLGDSILGFTLASYLYCEKESLQEGSLTKIRSLLVCEKTLAHLAQAMNLQTYLLLSEGSKKDGGLYNEAILADAVEAIFAAVYCDSDMTTVSRVILNKLNPYIKSALAGKLRYDYKSFFLELIQTKYTTDDVEFRLKNKSGPDHSPVFTEALYVKGLFLASASGKSKKTTEQEVCKRALAKLHLLGIDMAGADNEIKIY